MDHVVQLYQKLDGLADAVVEYIGAGLARGEGAVIIATPEHGTAFLARLSTADRSRLKVMDAEQTLATFMVGGRPQWQAFRQVILPEPRPRVCIGQRHFNVTQNASDEGCIIVGCQVGGEDCHPGKMIEFQQHH